MKRTEKEQAVGVLSERLQKAQAIILAEYRGLKVSELTEIRREVKKTSADLHVVKNRLAKRVMEGGGPASPSLGGRAGLVGHLKGPTAIVYTEKDPVELTKVLARYAETFEPFKLKVGFLGNQVISSLEIQALSKLPSREELYARMLGAMSAPATNLVRVLNAIPQKLAVALSEIGKRKT
ncbi:MAG: 50S ribosomal protein L10 [Deltaproteobacteria bacterium]|nr:50S ribosomal protein L10 [Deltaproteobacteria bacterium]